MRLAALVLATALGAAQAQHENLVPALGALERGDYAQAIHALKPLAAAGDLEAQYRLGVILETAPAPFTDLPAAHGWYLRAAQLGHAASQNNLGAMYFDGRGTDKDYAEAARWYRHAAEGGHAVAQTNLALMYGMGLGVRRDDLEMANWLQKAADAGSARAQAQIRPISAYSMGAWARQ